jgi:hypothetical protein
MSHVFTVELSDAEKKALEYVALSADDWIQNAAHERCRLAIEEMVNQEVARKLAVGEPISGSKEDIVLASTLPSAAQRHQEALAAMEAGPIIPS